MLNINFNANKLVLIFHLQKRGCTPGTASVTSIVKYQVN